jgi:hypothetical protein
MENKMDKKTLFDILENVQDNEIKRLCKFYNIPVRDTRKGTLKELKALYKRIDIYAIMFKASSSDEVKRIRMKERKDG